MEWIFAELAAEPEVRTRIQAILRELAPWRSLIPYTQNPQWRKARPGVVVFRHRLSLLTPNAANPFFRFFGKRRIELRGRLEILQGFLGAAQSPTYLPSV